ncbi:hypothetical protein [Chryseobacterium scophthalmum]|uniref:hypothetical protein n=1 Tax=Chryseobacterium scophthalmum TaxID=59733 RepID=UPI003D0584F5
MQLKEPNKKYCYLLIFSFLTIFSCRNENTESKVNGFDISPDKNFIVYSYKIDSLYTAFVKNIETGSLSMITREIGSNTNPKFTEDGKTIVSVFYDKENVSTEFHFYDIKQKKNIKKIKIPYGFISDYQFINKEKLLYLKSISFDSPSSFSPKSFHNYDIYILDIRTAKSEKISDVDSYFMGEIAPLNDSLVVVSMVEDVEKSGLYLFKKEKNATLENMGRIMILNDSLRKSTMYRNPVILSENNIICASSYQLVSLDLKSKLESQILPSNGHHYNQIRSRGETIYYKQNDNTDLVYYFDLNNKVIKYINLKIDSDIKN